MPELSATSLMLGQHLALMNRVLSDSSTRHRVDSAGPQAATSASYEENTVEFTRTGAGADTETGARDDYSGAASYFSGKGNLASPVSPGQELLEAMIEAMAGEAEDDRLGHIVNLYI